MPVPLCHKMRARVENLFMLSWNQSNTYPRIMAVDFIGALFPFPRSYFHNTRLETSDSN